MERWHLGVICTGNICRSPMAEIVFRDQVARDRYLDERVQVSSAGTARWHVGSPMDPQARSALVRAGFANPHTSGTFANRDYLNALDLAIVMTNEQRDDVKARIGNQLEVLLLRELLEPPASLDLADPYYGNDDEFDECLRTIQAAGQHLTLVLRQRLGADSREA
ncbi:MAG: hypothetical protein B7X07_00855 [Actinobacteria bacterium 21-64-8]|nr:MAG: hypothetical protein B7X07_00855 [Actinobacteria bacterium 21-64-8]